MKKGFLIVLSAVLLITSFLFTACDSWMQDDDFYSDIENDVKVANAAAVNAYVRYANSKMGTTEPSGSISKKVDVPFSVSAVTNDDYGFVKWVAFSTSDFPTNQQHTSLVYESAQAYARDYKGKELSSGFVSFTDPTNPITDVNIYAVRDDIFIMPLVAKRPTVVTSVPSNGRTDVVKNSQIRILFSKPIDENSLTDEFGNSNIQVTSGRAVLTENSDDMSALDITEYFNFKLSKTKKMLTISAKKNSAGVAVYKFDNNAQISVTLFEDLKDSDGFSMNGSYKFSFTTGTKEDSLAPRIDDLTAGIGQECLKYQQYKYNVSSTNYTQLAEAATNTLSTYVTEDAGLTVPILTQRVKDKLNIFVRATDIAGAGAAVTLGTDNQSENDVALVQVRACLYVDKNGNPVTTSADAFADGSIGTDTSNILYIREYGYSLGMKDSDCQVKGAFETVTSTQQDSSGNAVPNTSGTLFTYDLSRLDDGLVKIDIWAVDMVGNSGDEEAYAGTYNNGYRSIFVVKDSTAPDAATEVSKVITESGTDTNGVAAPYEWYNSTSLNKLQVKDQTGAANLIHDASNEFLRSKDNKLQWIFKVGNDPNWTPSATASGWSDIHTTSNEPIVRTLADAVSSSDGPVAITMCLKDDFGNISAPVLLNSINYDNTSPVLPATTSWVKYNATTSTYSNIVATTDSAELSESGHILKIPFTEEWAGLRRIKLTVQKDGTGTAVPQGSYTLRYVPQSGTARDIDYSGNDTLKILNVDDTNPVKTGTLYISGIKIGDENGGSYRVTVDLWDSSLNHSSTYSDISIDTTAPELTRVYIPGLKQSVTATSSGLNDNNTNDGWILPREYVKGPSGQSSNSSVAPGYIPLYLFIKEKDSGIHKISFASTDSVALFNSDSKKTTLYKIDNFGQTNEVRTLVPASNYTIDVTNKTITLVDNPDVKLSSASADGFVLLVKDIGFKSYTSAENTINVTVEDLATLTDNNLNTENNAVINPYTSGDTTITGVKVDSYLSGTNSTYTLKDRAGKANGSLSLNAATDYTNETKIDVEISVGDDSGSSAKSGYNSFMLSGAKFIPNETDVVIGNYHIPYQLSQDNTVITLRNMAGADFAATDKYIVLRSATFTIKNIQFDNDAEGEKSLSITAYDLAGWNHPASTKKITLDTTAPVLSKGPFTATCSYSGTGYDSAKTIYPHASGENATGEEVSGIATFYTSKKIIDDANADYAAVLGIRATDNIALSGTTDGTSTFLLYLTGSHTRAEVLSTGLTAGSEVISALTPANNTVKNSLFNLGLTTGTYSAVIVDKAGNTSDVFKFQIQQDTTGPVLTDSDEDDPKSLNEYVYLESPDAGSDVYKNEIDSFSDHNEFEFRPSTGYSDSIRTKKYVTKRANGKYKLILNLAAAKYTTTNLKTRLIDGDEKSTGAAYGELTAAAGNSPIEEYGVRTRYTNYPMSGHHDIAYEPSAPNPGYWHKFENRTGTGRNTDGNNIYSYVEGNNIIIELPQENTAPVSVFLKDACGNYSYIVLGLQGDGTTNNYSIAPSYILDVNLGYAQTNAEGEVVTPVVMQNPYMTSGGTGHYWGEINSKVGYTWNNQSGNTDGTLTASNATTDYGESGHLGFIRDRAKKATYYNPDINSSQNVKIGLTLRFGEAYNTITNPESVTFEEENQKAPAADVTAKKYTARALLYCTQSTTKPTKQTILDCYNSEFATGGEQTGRITDWTYVKANNLTSEVTMLLDYPKPDYSKLTDWTLKNSNKEPEPYYIWYLLEDRVGNYEIAKIVNSGALGDALKTTTSGMYDRWFYDAEKPKITIRGETTLPQNIESTLADVNKLVATNNGYIPYLQPGTTAGTYTNNVYVSASLNHTIRATNLKNTNVGNGTTHHVEEAGDDAAERVGYKNRTWLPFFDIEISEATGVRAFCWSNSPTAPAFDNSYVQSTNNTQGDYSSSGTWYAGYTATNLDADIGCDFHYDGSSNGRDATNAYFSYTDSSSAYKGVYSGTKVNTVIPFNRITSQEPLYLHVMDWIGNVKSVRIGKNLVFINDATKPTITTGSYTGVSEPNKYYIEKASGYDPVLRIAGQGTYATSHQAIEVDLPGISDNTGGAGILGYSFENLKPETATAKLSIPYTTYGSFGTTTSTATSLTYFVYDKVGNISQGSLKGVFDATPPELANVKIQVSGSGSLMFAMGDSSTSTSKTYTGASAFVENPNSITSFNTVYINKNSVASFDVNLTTACVNEGDLASIEIYQWDAGQTKWVRKDSVAAVSGQSEYNISNTNISYTTSGTIYQILATDISGNTSCQYFKLYLDNVAPGFESVPMVTITKGSINKDSSSTSNVYYYTADTSHKMSVSFTLDDANGIGSKIANDNIHYYYRIGSSGDWQTLNSASAALEFTNETVESIYVKDELGNISEATPLKYVYGEGATDYKEIAKLQFYNTAVSANSTYTAKAGWPNYYEDNSCNILTDTSNNPTGVLIKGSYYSNVKISFNKPAGIIGYVAKTTSTPSPSTDVGAYSMKSLSTEFEVSLSDDKNDTTKYFYAVDYVGQTREIALLLSYKNPLAAQNIVFLPADSDEIPDTITSELALTPTVDSGNTRYYKNGWIVLRCTLKKNDAGTTYSAIPTTIKLYDTNNIYNSTQPLSTHTGTSDLKGYSSTTFVGEGANKRYYYYLAVELSDSHKDKKLYCVMSDASNNTSDATALGNVTWKQDTEAPTITSQYVVTENSINKLKGFVLTDSENNVISSIGKARDSFKGNGYQSNLYPSGARVFFKWRHSSSNQYIKDNSGTIAKYKFVVTTPETASNEYFNATASVSDADWKDITLQPFASDIFENAYCYMFELPDNFAPHCHLALFLMDKFGNVSAPYYLIHEANNTKVQWWLTEQTFTDYTFVSNADHTTYSIKLPLGTVINNISVNGAEIDSFKFIDYTKGDPSVSDLSNGWIVLKGSDAVGLTVTLKNLAADWSEKPVNLKINNVEKTVYTIPAKTLTADDIQLGTATPSETAGQYTISATIPDAAKSRISEDPVVTGTNITGVTAAWNGDKSVITITGASSIWDGDRTIGLTIKTSDGNFDKNNVLSVGKKTINGSGFSLGTMDSENKVLVTFTDISTPATIINASGHNLMVGKTPESEGSVVSGATVEYDSTTKKFTITGMPGPAWSGQQNFTIKVNTLDGNFDNGGIIHTVAQRTLSVSDLTISDVDPATWSNSIDAVSFKITAASGITIQSVNAQANHSCTSNNGTYTISPSNTGAKIPQGISVEVVTDKGTKTKYIYLPANEVDANIRGTGFTAGGIRAVIGGTVAEEVSGSRFVQFINTVTDTFSTDSDFTADSSVTEKPAKKVKKAAKKAKKQGKKASAKVVSTGSTTAGSGVTAGKPVMAVETAEILDQTLTSAVPELTAATETVVSEIAGVTEKAAGKSEVIATVETNEKMNSTGSTTEEAEQASAEEGSRSPSKSASIVIMLAILSSFGAVWYLQRNRKK